MIVVTGAAGFIGSALLGRLIESGYGDLVAVDAFGQEAKMKNLQGKHLRELVDRSVFHEWLAKNGEDVQIILHMGARTDTSEFNEVVLNNLNLDYSKKIWQLCHRFSIPLIYASSAATYGGGEQGFEDDHLGLKKLQPLNPYGWSKHKFDMWVMEQEETPPFWAGFKFFNVFGPNEYHKGRMASVVFHAFHQIRNNGNVKLFRSHKSEYLDGMQLRDFIYISDVLNVLMHFMENRKFSDLYNLGTGVARSFHDLATSVFHALDRTPEISFVDIPEDIREKYQYYTCANMQKMRNSGFETPFVSLESGIQNYVQEYLLKDKYY